MTLSEKELIKKADRAVKQHKYVNPDGRVSWQDLNQALNVLAPAISRDELNGVKYDMKEIIRERSPGLFATKLVTNAKKAHDYIHTISGLFPDLDADDKKRYHQFREKLKKVITDNLGKDIDVKKLAEYKSDPNYQIAIAARKELYEEYSNVIEKKKKVDEERNEIKTTPLIKPEFDYITDEDIRGVEISPGDIEGIWIFLERSRK